MDQKLLLVYAFLVLGSAITCKATTYMVGDNSGWDISTNLDTWANDKTFNVGDVLVFQYSSSNSVSEVTKENFDNCDTTKVLETYSAGNTTITLKKPGDRYFVSGNKLYCLGGMKLHIHVENNQAYAPTGAPQATPGSDQADLPNPSSKNNIPTSTAFSHIGGTNTILLGFLGLVVSMLWNVIN